MFFVFWFLSLLFSFFLFFFFFVFWSLLNIFVLHMFYLSPHKHRIFCSPAFFNTPYLQLRSQDVTATWQRETPKCKICLINKKWHHLKKNCLFHVFSFQIFNLTARLDLTIGWQDSKKGKIFPFSIMSFFFLSFSFLSLLLPFLSFSFLFIKLFGIFMNASFYTFFSFVCFVLFLFLS